MSLALKLAAAMGSAAAGGGGSQEDFTTYTEVDALSCLSSTTDTSTATNLTGSGNSHYIYKDSGADYWDGLITSSFTFRVDGLNSGGIFQNFGTFSVELGSLNGPANTPANALMVSFLSSSTTAFDIRLYEAVGGSYVSDISSGTFNLATDYFLKLVRDKSIGTYGTAYLYIYSDADRTNLLETLELTLRSGLKDYRYNYSVQGYDGAGGQTTYSVSDMTITNV